MPEVSAGATADAPVEVVAEKTSATADAPVEVVVPETNNSKKKKSGTYLVPQEKKKGKFERQASSKGGFGLFATKDLDKNESVFALRPALSVIFDSEVKNVCSYCFVERDKAERKTIKKTIAKQANGSFGIRLDEKVPRVLARPDEQPVEVDDLIVDINGKAVKSTADAVVELKKTKEKADIKIERKFVFCEKSYNAICAACSIDTNHCTLWQYERLKPCPRPPRGDSSVMRFMWRYKILQELKQKLDFGDAREDVSLVSTLATEEDPGYDTKPIKNLADRIGLPFQEALIIVGQTRTNAGELVKKNRKAGCTLSVHQGYLNHSCKPNCEIEIQESGKVKLKTLRKIVAGEEMLISYIPTNWGRAKRQELLKEHYKFDCTCERCVAEAK